MDNDTVTRDIFNALDNDKKGYVSKQHFINQMAEYLSQTEVACTDYTLNKLNLVNKYPDLIDYQNFKRFYEDLMESSKKCKSVSLSDEDIMGNDSDSDVYENELGPCLDINSSHSTLQGSVLNLIDFPVRSQKFSSDSLNRRRSIASYVPMHDVQMKRRSGYNSPGDSLRRRGFENLISARSSLSSNLGVGYPTSNLEDGKHLNGEDFDEVSCMTDSGVSVATEEVDRLFNSYKTVVGELTELKQKLEDSNNRYQKQRDMTRMHNERILMLEEQIRQLETSQNEEIKMKKKELKVTLESLQQRKDMEHEKHKYNDRLFRQDVINRLNALESEYNASRSEYERMKHECDVLLKEKDELKKELKLSNRRCQELENTLQNYKDVVSTQITDLQKERDNAEKINKELHDKVEEMRVTYKCQDPNNWTSSSSLNSPVQNRPQSWAGPFNFLGHSSSISKNSLDGGSGVSTSPSCTTISQLENVVYRLTMENRNLVEKVTHLEALEFYQRKRAHISNNFSVADELDHLNVKDLKNALASEQEIATRLQIYIMGLTNRLMMAGYIEAFRHG